MRRTSHAVLVFVLAASSGQADSQIALGRRAASPESPPPIVTIARVSRESPYSPGDCGDDATQYGYETDPSFTVSPQGLIAAWEQDTYNDMPGAVVGYSRDRGVTWNEVVPPSPASCQSQPPPYGSGVWEPALAVDGLGTVVMVIGNGGPSPTFFASASHDGGASWSQPTGIQVATGQLMTGPVKLVVDPSDPSSAGFAWISHQPPDAVWFARSGDEGASWSIGTPVHLAPPGMIVYRDTPFAFSNGMLLDVATDISYLDLPVGPSDKNLIGAPHDVVAARSSDHGLTWTEMTIANLSPAGFSAGETLGPDGSVYVLISDGAGPNQTWRIIRSTDGGVSWQQFGRDVPVPNNALPTFGDLSGANLATVGFAVADDGTIGVLYDEARTLVPDDPKLTTDVWLTYSRDGAQSWTDVHLAGPFDANALPASAPKLGDYQVLKPVDGGFGALFFLGPCTAEPSESCPATTDGPTDVYFARIAFPQ